MADVDLAATFFIVVKIFVGEIILERFSVLRHKFFKGGYGEEKQAIED